MSRIIESTPKSATSTWQSIIVLSVLNTIFTQIVNIICKYDFSLYLLIRHDKTGVSRSNNVVWEVSGTTK